MKIAKILIRAGLQRSEKNGHLRIAGDYLFPIEGMALELFRGGVLIVDCRLYLLSGWDLQFRAIHTVILDDDHICFVSDWGSHNHEDVSNQHRQNRAEMHNQYPFYY